MKFLSVAQMGTTLVHKNFVFSQMCITLPFMETQDFRKYLQSELVRRCEKNRQYSLRSFARDLRVHHGTLSKLLSGQRKLSLEMFEKLCGSLELDPKQVEIFISTGFSQN